MPRKKAETQTYRIPVSTGIFEHTKGLGQAVYLLMYYIDHTTEEISCDDGSKIGKVYGGAPLHDEDAASALGVSVFTIRRWRKRLADGPYIRQKRTPIGYAIEVLKSKKWWRPGGEDGHGVTKTGNSDLAGMPTQTEQPCQVRVSNPAKSDLADVATPIKTKQVQSNNPSNQPKVENGNAGDLVGRLAFLFETKTGVPLGTTEEQRQEVARLAGEDGEADVIGFFGQWLGRPQGTDGLAWPLAAFIKEYGVYSRKRAAQQEEKEKQEAARVSRAEEYRPLRGELTEKQKEERANALRLFRQLQGTPEGKAAVEGMGL